MSCFNFCYWITTESFVRIVPVYLCLWNALARHRFITRRNLNTAQQYGIWNKKRICLCVSMLINVTFCLVVLFHPFPHLRRCLMFDFMGLQNVVKKNSNKYWPSEVAFVFPSNMLKCMCRCFAKIWYMMQKTNVSVVLWSLFNFF